MASSSSTRSRLHHPKTQLQQQQQQQHHHQQQQRQHSPTSSSSTSKTTTAAVSSHLAMVDLKQRILSSLSKLSDRDTHHLAVEELERIARSLPPEGLPMFLNSLLHDPPPPLDSPSTARRECLRLLALLCSSHPEPAAAHLPKIVSHIARRLKESSSDSSVREACRDAAGTLSKLYLAPNDHPAGESYSAVVALFVKPLLEAMGEQSKGVQAGSAACLAKVVECAAGGRGCGADGEPRRAAFQKLVPRVCKLLSGQSFLAKGSLLSVVSSLAQVGAITPQSMQSVLQCIRDCLESSEWATRKAAADTLSVLAVNSNHLVGDGAASTLTALEACRFDKVKPVRDSVSEALVQWKKLVLKDEDATSEDAKNTSKEDDNKNPACVDSGEKPDAKSSNANDRTMHTRDSLADSSSTADSSLESKNANIPEKAVVFLRKKAPSLTDKELNLEFFQKLETRSSDDLPVEVVLPRKCLQSLLDEDKKGPNNDGSREIPEPEGQPRSGSRGSSGAGYNVSDKRMGLQSRMQDTSDFARDRWNEQRTFKGKDLNARAPETGESSEISHRDASFAPGGTSRVENHSEMNKGSWFAIQRQLSQLERQQANLMNILQDFMGGSHDSMITLENRVRGLERIVEDMARELSLSGRRSSGVLMGFDGSSGRSSSKFNGFSDYNSKFSRGPEGRVPYTERFLSSDGMAMRARDPNWRSDSEAWGSYGYSAARNGSVGSRRNFGGPSADGRLPRTENDDDQVGSRRGWEKGQGPFRLGEGPSARSVWQASKDEATLEAIRVAGEDNGVQRAAAPKKAIRELDAEVEDQNAPERGPLWASWSHAMDSLRVGDVDSAYADILSTGDDLLLVKLMDKSGPVVDQLSSEIGNEILHVLGQLLQEQSLHDLVLTWFQQLSDLVAENGPEFLGIHVETKREVLLGLHEASSLEHPEEWEGATADQLMRHLAGAWGVNLQQLV